MATLNPSSTKLCVSPEGEVAVVHTSHAGVRSHEELASRGPQPCYLSGLYKGPLSCVTQSLPGDSEESSTVMLRARGKLRPRKARTVGRTVGSVGPPVPGH